VSVYVNLKQWESLPKEYQGILESACASAQIDMQAKYDVKNPQAMRRLIAAGTQLRPFPRDVLVAAEKEAFALYDELAAANPRFAKLYSHWKAFRADEIAWFRVAEQPFDNFVSSSAGAAARK
jgi:TRAP-type mannitol/chloroaromatic compound transport system substrate-binding protein